MCGTLHLLRDGLYISEEGIKDEAGGDDRFDDDDRRQPALAHADRIEVYTALVGRRGRYDKGEGEGGIAGIEGQAQQGGHAGQDGEPEGRREGQKEYDHRRVLAGHRFCVCREA